MVVRRVLVLLGVPLVLAACALPSGGRVEAKSGGDSPVGVTVMTADGSGTAPAGQTSTIGDFVAALGTVSSDQIRAEIGSRYSDPELKDGEAQLVKDLANGSVDAAVVATRAFSAAGIPVLDVLETPFLVTSYDAERALVAAPFADELLQRFDGSGIHALALTVGPLRRAVVAGPALTNVDAWRGTRFRTNSSTVQDDTVRALGGTFVHERFQWTEMIASGRLDGAEADLANMIDRGVGYGTVVTGDLVLWPKISVVAVSDRYWKSLGEKQQQWLRDAAVRTRDASVAATWDEDAAARQLCTAGVRVAMSGDRQRAALAAAVAPVTTRLETDPAYRPLRAISDAHPTSPLKVPTSCIGSVPAVEKPTTTPAPSGAPLPAFPDGTYRVRLTEAEVLASGNSNHDGWSGTWTLEVADGRYTLSCMPTAGSIHDCGNADGPLGGPLEAGTVTASSDSYEFHFSAEAMAKIGRCSLPADPMQLDGHCPPDSTYRVGPVSLDGDTLVITDYDGRTPAMTLKPWDRLS